jgi:Tol biopolymer transport system component
MPRWSRDGRKILFYSSISGSDQLYVMNADGSKRKLLTDNTHNNKTGVWSHDGKKIVFKSDRGGKWAVYAMHADGKDVKLLTEDCDEFGHPVWSADDQKIFYTATRAQGTRIFVMNANGAMRARSVRNEKVRFLRLRLKAPLVELPAEPHLTPDPISSTRSPERVALRLAQVRSE